MNIKQKVLPIFAVSFLIAGLVSVFAPTPTANALNKTQKENCYKKWAGAYTGSSGDGRKLDANGLKKFENSNCYEDNKGSCKLDRYEDGASIRCQKADGAYDNGNAGWNGTKPASTGNGENPEALNKGATGTCGGVGTSIIKCDQDNSGDIESNAIWGLLLIAINILTAGIGLVAVGGIIYAAILYTTAQDKAAQVTKAKEVIFNVILGLVLFALMYAFLQFLIPGGVFQ